MSKPQQCDPLSSFRWPRAWSCLLSPLLFVTLLPTSACQQAPAAISSSDGLPAVRAEYELQVSRDSNSSGSERFTLWRDAEHVARRDHDSAQGPSPMLSLWQRDSAGQISYWRVVDRDEKVVEYTPGDLRAAGRQVDWHQLSRLMQSGLLDQLEGGNERSVLGQRARSYRGDLGEDRYEVQWLEDVELPARIEVRSSSGKQVLKLLDLRPLSADPADAAHLVGHDTDQGPAKEWGHGDVAPWIELAASTYERVDCAHTGE